MRVLSFSEHEQPKEEPEPNGNLGQNPRKTDGHARNDSGKQAATETEASNEGQLRQKLKRLTAMQETTQENPEQDEEEGLAKEP